MKKKKEAPRKKSASNRYLTAFIALTLLFLAVKTAGLKYASSDENIYFYMGKLVADGKMPYRDFFLSHPPLGILINALIFKLLGFNFTALKIVPVIAAALGGLYLFKTLSEAYDGRTALLAAALFLFSYDTLRASAHPTGINVTVLLMLVSFHHFMRGSNVLAGVFMGLAAAAGLYSLVLLGSYLIYLLWKKADFKSIVLPLLAGFTAVSALVSGFFYLSAGWDYVYDTLIYHMQKPRLDEQNLLTIRRVFEKNLLVFIPAIGSSMLFIGRRVKNTDAILATIALAYAVFIANMSSIYDFYFMLMFPFLAALSSRSILSFCDMLKDWKTAALVVLAVALYLAWSAYGYVEHEEIYFKTVAEISRFVESNTSPSQEIFGDSTSVPLIALLSGRKIALDEVDTNYQRFTSNTTDLNRMLQRLDADGNFKFFIVTRQGIGYLKETKSYLKAECKPVKQYPDPVKGAHTIYDCKK